MKRIGIILNPNSRGNRKRPHRVEALRNLMGERGRVFATQSEEELHDVLQELQEWDAQCLVSTGGDGALNWMLNEAAPIWAAAGQPLPPMVPSNAGTIDFVARKLKISGRAEAIVKRLALSLEASTELPCIALDSLELVGKRTNGEPFRRIGFAVAAGGVGNHFFDELYRYPRYGGPEILRIVAMAIGSQTADWVPLPLPGKLTDFAHRLFRTTEADVSLDGEKLAARHFSALNAGAFDIVLGPFKFFPLARESGTLHFQAGDLGALDIMRSLPSLFRGGLVDSSRIIEKRATEMVIEARGSEVLHPVVDGEIFRDLASVTIRPGPSVRFLQV